MYCRQQEELQQLGSQASAASEQLQNALQNLQQELQGCQVPPAHIMHQMEGLEQRLGEMQALQAAHKAADDQLARCDLVCQCEAGGIWCWLMICVTTVPGSLLLRHRFNKVVLSATAAWQCKVGLPSFTAVTVLLS